MTRESLRPPPLAELLRSAGPYPSAFAARMREIDASLPERMDELNLLDDGRAEQVLACALSYACQCQHYMNITLGRAALAATPRDWTVSRVVRVARSTLKLQEAWEVRRFLEVLLVLDVESCRAFAAEMLGSSDEEIREAAEDLLEIADEG